MAYLGPLALVSLLTLSIAPSSAHDSAAEKLSDLGQRLTSGSSERGELFLQRAQIERRLGRHSAARTSLRCAEVWGARELGVAQEKCRLLLASGDPARAADLMGPWLTRAPQDYETRMLRAEARLAAGAFDGAAVDLEIARAMSLEQFTIDAEVSLADAWGRANRPYLALAALDRAIQRRGTRPGLVEAAIEIELAAQRFDAALRRHDGQQPPGATNARWLSRRGDLLALAGRKTEARTAWAAARDALGSLPPRRRRTAAATRLLTEVNGKLNSAPGS